MTIYQLPNGQKFDIPDSVSPEDAISGLKAKFAQKQLAPQPAISSNVAQEPSPEPAQEPSIPAASIEQPEQGSILDLLGAAPTNAQEQQRTKDAVKRFPSQVSGALQSRETFRAAGGTLGSALGIPAGPIGIVGGGALGAAGGDALFNIIESAKNIFSGKEKAEVTSEGVIEAFKSPIQAGTSDLVATLGLGVAGKALRGVSPLLGKFVGVAKEEAKELAQLANKLGVPLGAINVSASEAIKGFAKVAGVFPFIGTPVRQAQKTAQILLDESLDRTLNNVAPTASLQEVGIDLTKAAQNRFKAFRRLSGSLYDDFLKKAENASIPDIFPTTNLKAAATNVKTLQEAGEIVLDEGRKFGRVESDAITSFIEDSIKLPERLTAQQIRGLQSSLQEMMSKAAADGFDVSRGIKLKKALELDFNNPQVDLLNFKEGKDLVSSLTNANKFFADNIKAFQTATTKKFGRIEKNIFKPKFFSAGSKEADEAFSVIFNAKSPQALNNLRAIVGPKPFKRAVRKHLDTAIEKSVLEAAEEGAPRIFDPLRLEKELGLATPEGRRVLEAMLKDTPLKIKDFDDFNRVAKAVGSVEIPDVSTFIKRRAILGGGKAVAGSFVAGLGLTSPLRTIAIMVAARKGLRLLSDPAKLKSLTTALDSTLPEKLQRSAVLRLIRNIPNKEERSILVERLNQGEQNNG